MATLYTDETVATARAMKAAGKRPREIAIEFGAHPDTVKHWLNGTRGSIAKTRIVFTEAEILKIRHLRAVMGIGQHDLARRFETSQTVISRITRGESYKRVGGYILAPKARDGGRKLSNADVRKVRELRAAGHSSIRIARRFKVSKALIFAIVAGTLRGDVT